MNIGLQAIRDFSWESVTSCNSREDISPNDIEIFKDGW
jgi:hypothetical protein